MAHGRPTIKVHVKVAWWLIPYLRGVEFVARAMNLEPDMEKVLWHVRKGIRVTVDL